MTYKYQNNVISAEEEGLSFEGLCQSWHTAEDAKDVVEAIQDQKIVHYLKMAGNTIGVNAAMVIGMALEAHPEFRKALWKDMFTGRLKNEIPKALKYLGQGLMKAKAQLTVLDLSDNALGPNGMKGLEELLRSSVCYTLQELHLNNCGLGIYGGRMLSKAIRDCLENSIKDGTPLQLKVFIAGRNRLENEGAKAIGEMISELKTLEVIMLPQNSIYYSGIEALAEGISCNPNLRVLNLNDNIIRTKGASYLAQAISNTLQLQEIDLGDCLLKDGSIYIAEVLEEQHLNLEEVNLSFNEVNARGGLIIAAAMKNKPNLKKLMLDGNSFGQDGLDNIIEEMQSAINPTALCTMDENQSDYETEEEDEYDDDDIDEDDEEDPYIDDVSDDNIEEDEVNIYGDEEGVYVEQDDYSECGYEETIYTTSQELGAGLSLNETSFPDVNVVISEDNTIAPIITKPTTSSESPRVQSPITNFWSSAMTSPSMKAKMSAPKVTTMTPSSSSRAPELFCLNQEPCTKEMFDALDVEDKFQALMEIIDKFQGDNHLLLLIFTALKCAHLSSDIPEALDLAIKFYAHIIEYAIKTEQERRVTNYILMQLGLLRCEEKFKSDYNRKNCCLALQKTLSNDSLTSNYMVNTFKVFLDSTESIK